MINGERISAFVLCLNEEDCIRDCLASIAWADEILVVDSFSTDGTLDIAREFTDNIVRQEFLGYVGQTRFAFEHTTCPWVLWLDADERITREAHAQIVAEFSREGGPAADGYAFPRKTWFLDRWITHSGWYPQHKLRLARRSSARIEGSEPHPVMVCEGKVRDLRGDILHLSYPGGMVDMVRQSAKFAEMAAQDRVAHGRRFHMHNLCFKPPFEFFKKYVLMRGVLDGLPGLTISIWSAYYRFMRELKMWELEHSRAPEPFVPPATGGDGDDARPG